jgi:uncharacterized protein
MAKTPWYRDGLRFQCTGCGDCCSGEPGYVWVNETEIAALAAHMEMPVEQFEVQFVRQVGSDKSLIERPGGDCIFLDIESRKCSVYDARPIQCRTWPFWDSTVKRKKDWEATCRACPGSGQGRLYSFAEIEIQRKSKAV